MKPPALPMPAQDRLRSHQVEVLPSAVRPGETQPHPEDPIVSSEPWMRIGTQDNLELVTENEVLEREITPGATGGDDDTKNEEWQAEHGSG